jgi:hypothetical protein
MFWRDGFQALAALDDNRDGWLSGDELKGVAVWIDRNQNGKSDAGEVISLREAGIEKIGVEAAMEDGILSHPQGVVFSDGRRAPAYDWIAESRPVTTSR